MSEENDLMDKVEDTANDILDDVKNSDGKLPQMLNVLTILTFVGAGLGALVALLALIGAGAALGNIPGFAAGGGGSLTVYFILVLLANAACIYGAIQMRKLSKMGFYIYVAGQAIALIGLFAFVGFAVMAVIWPALFIGLYSTQLKELK